MGKNKHQSNLARVGGYGFGRLQIQNQSTFGSGWGWIIFQKAVHNQVVFIALFEDQVAAIAGRLLYNFILCTICTPSCNRRHCSQLCMLQSPCPMSYANVLQNGLPLKTTQKLQSVHNVALQAVIGTSNYAHVTFLLHSCPGSQCFSEWNSRCHSSLTKSFIAMGWAICRTTSPQLLVLFSIKECHLMVTRKWVFFWHRTCSLEELTIAPEIRLAPAFCKTWKTQMCFRASWSEGVWLYELWGVVLLNVLWVY